MFEGVSESGNRENHNVNRNQLEESSISFPLGAQVKAPRDALACIERHLRVNGPLTQMLTDIKAYYSANNWDILKIAVALDLVCERQYGAELSQVLIKMLKDYMSVGKPLGSLLSSFCELTEPELWQRKSLADVGLDVTCLKVSQIRAYSEVRNFLILYQKRQSEKQMPISALDLAELARDTIELVLNSAKATHLKIFYAMFIRACITDTAVPSMQDTDLLEAMKTLISFSLNLDQAKTLLDLIGQSDPNLTDFSELILEYVRFLKFYFDIESKTFNVETWKFTTQSLLEATTQGRVMRLLDLFNDMLPQYSSKTSFEFLNSVFAFHHGKAFTTAINWGSIKSFCRQITNSKISSAYLANYAKAVEAGVLSSQDDSLKLLKTMCEHVLAFKLLQSDSEVERSKTLTDLRHFSTSKVDEDANGETGRLSFDPLRGTFVARNTWRERHSLDPLPHELRGLYYFDKMFDHYHGFSALTYECKRPPSKEPPLLARFAHDLGKIRLINAEEIGQFPGRGFTLHGLELERIFVADRHNHDRFHVYKHAWPGLADEFNDLANTAFIFCRGLIALGCHSPQKFSLILPDGRQVHYSYVVFNEHFRNPLCKVAFLVPTKLIKDKFRDSYLNYDDYKTFDPGKPDVNKLIWSPETLVQFAIDQKLPIFEVGRAANITNGFSHLADISVMPQFTKLKKLIEKHNHEMNRWNGGLMYRYSSTEREEVAQSLLQMRREIAGLQEDLSRVGSEGSSVLDILGRYHNLFDLFRLSLALWHKGQTAGKGLTADNEDYFQQRPQANPEFDFDIEESRETPEVISEYDQPSSDTAEIRRSGAAELNPNALRMLVEAYNWYSSGHECGLKRKDFPVLVAANTLDYWKIAPSPFVLDTWNLTLSIEGETIELPQWSNGKGPEEVEVWAQKVLPRIQSSLTDLRFYDRASLIL